MGAENKAADKVAQPPLLLGAGDNARLRPSRSRPRPTRPLAMYSAVPRSPGRQ
jgi:hypothetical protein